MQSGLVIAYPYLNVLVIIIASVINKKRALQRGALSVSQSLFAPGCNSEPAGDAQRRADGFRSIPELVIRMKRAVSASRCLLRRNTPCRRADRRSSGRPLRPKFPLYGTRAAIPSGTNFFDIVLHVLEITVFSIPAALLERTHAAISLEFTSVVDDRLAGRLLRRPPATIRPITASALWAKSPIRAIRN